MFDRVQNTSLVRSVIKEKNLLWIWKADKMIEVILQSHCYKLKKTFWAPLLYFPPPLLKTAWELPPNAVYKVYTKDTRTILNRFYALLSCFHYLLWTSKFQLGRYSRLGNRYSCFHCNFNCVKSIIFGFVLSSITLSTWF